MDFLCDDFNKLVLFFPSFLKERFEVWCGLFFFALKVSALCICIIMISCCRSMLYNLIQCCLSVTVLLVCMQEEVMCFLSINSRTVIICLSFIKALAVRTRSSS